MNTARIEGGDEYPNWLRPEPLVLAHETLARPERGDDVLGDRLAGLVFAGVLQLDAVGDGIAGEAACEVVQKAGRRPKSSSVKNRPAKARRKVVA